jgi:hypothetical protein
VTAASVERNVNKRGLRQPNCAIKLLSDARIIGWKPEVAAGWPWAGNEGRKKSCSIQIIPDSIAKQKQSKREKKKGRRWRGRKGLWKSFIF